MLILSSVYADPGWYLLTAPISVIIAVASIWLAGRRDRKRKQLSDDRLHGAVFGYKEGATVIPGIVDIVRGNGNGNVLEIAERSLTTSQRVETAQHLIATEVTSTKESAANAAALAKETATRLAAKVDATATELKMKVDETAVSLAAKVDTTAGDLAAKVADTTEVFSSQISALDTKLSTHIEDDLRVQNDIKASLSSILVTVKVDAHPDSDAGDKNQC